MQEESLSMFHYCQTFKTRIFLVKSLRPLKADLETSAMTTASQKSHSAGEKTASEALHSRLWISFVLMARLPPSAVELMIIAKFSLHFVSEKSSKAIQRALLKVNLKILSHKCPPLKNLNC